MTEEDTRWPHMVGGVSTPYKEFPELRSIELRVLDDDGATLAWVEQTFAKLDFDSMYPEVWTYVYNKMTECLEDYLAANDGWLIRRAISGDVHVIPMNDGVEHEIGDCVCIPAIDPVKRSDGSMGWSHIHHSLDGREKDE